MELPITSLMAALAAIGLVLLSVPISRRRMKLQASLGHAEDPILHRRIRAHGNFVEFAPIGLIVIGLVELAAVDTAVVWCLAGALAAGRLSHAIGMLTNRLPPRMAGMILTFLSLLAGAAILLFVALG